MEVLRTLGQKLRGIAGLGLVAGTVALFLGAGWTVIQTWVTHGFFPDLTNGYFLRDTMLPHILEWMTRGAFLGSGFGAGITFVLRGRRFDEISVANALGIGAGIGAILWGTTLAVRALGNPLSLLTAASMTIPWLAGFVVIGTGASAALLQSAKGAEKRAVSATSAHLLKDGPS